MLCFELFWIFLDDLGHLLNQIYSITTSLFMLCCLCWFGLYFLKKNALLRILLLLVLYCIYLFLFLLIIQDLSLLPHPLSLQIIPFNILRNLVYWMQPQPLNVFPISLLSLLRVVIFLPELQTLGEHGFVLSQVLSLAENLENGVNFTTMFGNKLTLIAEQPLILTEV